MRPLRALLLGLGLLLAALAPAAAQNIEHFRNFDVRIDWQADGSVEVVERMEVFALGQAIRRGIFRDLDVPSLDLLGLLRPRFEVVAATRNGQPERYRVERMGFGVRLYLGQEDVLLPHGWHVYELRYRLGEQTRRADGLDELYWNVNGTEWNFPMLRVAVDVRLPEGAAAHRWAAYTGRAGEQGRDFRVLAETPGRIAVESSRTFAAGENLTIAIGVPPGIIAQEERFGWLRWLATQNPLHVTGALLAILLAYYLFAWFRVGRDPLRGTIIPVYHPETPPAAMRFIRRMGHDNDVVAAALISLAVKGHLRFAEEGTKIRLERTVPPDGARAPSEGEGVLLAALLGPRASITLDRANQSALWRASNALRMHFEKRFNRLYFRRNRGWFAGGVLLTVLGWVVLALTQPVFLIALPALGIMGMVGFAVLSIGGQALKSLRAWRSGMGGTHLLGAIVGGVMILPFSGALVFVTFGAAGEAGLEVAVGVLSLVLVNALFMYLLKAPTAVGREALDEIEGTRLYLTVAEAERMRFHNPPDRTPEHFEELLPYAVALGVETAWTSQFTTVLAAAAAARHEGEYHPRWYRGSRFSGARLSGIGAAIGSSYGSAAAPASSGGSGGGGRSGGGGGGRGGGGW